MSEEKTQENNQKQQGQNKKQKVTADDRHKITFNKPYKFENKEYTEVDLSGLEEMTGQDMKDIEEMLSGGGSNPITFELTLSGAFMIASKVTTLPVEFFDQLPAVEAVKVKNHVLTFFTGSG